MNFNHVLICCLFFDFSYLLRSNEMTLRQAFKILRRYPWGMALEGAACENGLCPVTRVPHRAAPLPLTLSLPPLHVCLRCSLKISSGEKRICQAVSRHVQIPPLKIASFMGKTGLGKITQKLWNWSHKN